MLARSLIYILINAFCLVGLASDLPTWITSSQTSDASYFYVICSGESLEPQQAQELTENKCLASAAKLGGVSIVVKGKTVQSLTGADSSESTELTPITKNVNCEFTDRFLEKVDSGYRLWLKCRVNKKGVNSAKYESSEIVSRTIAKKEFKRALVTIIMKPKADVILIGNEAGERAIDVNSNVMNVEINESDVWIIAKRNGYKDVKQNIPDLKNGEAINLVFNLKKGI